MSKNSVDVTYTVGDIFAVNVQAWRRLLIAFAIIEFLLVAIVIGFPMLDGWTFREAVVWGFWEMPIYGGLFYLLFLAGICPLISYFRTRRQGLLGPNRFSFSDEGVRVESPKVQSLVFWSALKRVVATNERLFLFVTPASAFILPKRVFDDQAEFKRWIDTAKGHQVDDKAVEPVK